MAALHELDHVAYIRYASVYRNFGEAKDFEAFVDKELGTDTPTARKISSTDCHWMRLVAASRRAEGRTAENPPVGTLSVRRTASVCRVREGGASC